MNRLITIAFLLRSALNQVMGVTLQLDLIHLLSHRLDFRLMDED